MSNEHHRKYAFWIVLAVAVAYIVLLLNEETRLVTGLTTLIVITGVTLLIRSNRKKVY